jgi:hypothetical protein
MSWYGPERLGLRLRKLGYPFERMKRGSWAPLLCLALVTVSLPVWAQHRSGPATTTTTSAEPPQTEDQLKAQQHFQKAKELYQAGNYREAISELEVARKLDPKAKDLVMNLGIVHEKLGKYDEAIVYLRSYLEMEGVTAAERAKGEGMIKRIEGAKKEVPTTPTATVTAPATGSAPPPPPPDPPARGRIDAATIVVGSIAAVGIIGGSALGIYALTSRPSDGSFVTGRDGSYAALQEKTDDAHTFAIIADVGIGVGVIAALVTGWLYFGRTKDPSVPTKSTGSRSQVSLSFMSPGAALGGTF